jgi:hypothetical protein
MDRLELQKLRDLPIEGVAERLGLQVVRHKCLCPFHDDHHASLSFSVRRNSYRCFVCGASGGTIDLVMHYLGKPFREACRWLAEGPPLLLPQGGGTARSESLPSGRFGGGRDLFFYARFFERPFLNDEARRFLYDERRIDPRVVRWCRLTSWRDKQGVPWLQIPYYNREGKLIGIQNRNLTPSRPPQGEALNHSPTGDKKSSPRGGLEGVPRFRFPSGSRCTIYNLPVLNLLKPGESLWITEGCSDCWAMLSAGHKAIAIPSATLLKRKDVEHLSLITHHLSLHLHMFPDRDEPGERLFMQLKELLPTLVHHQLPPDCKDFSEYFLTRK